MNGAGMAQPPIDRAFVRIEEGLVHYRRLAGGGHPLMMFHPSPNSSRGLVPVMQALRAAGCQADMLALDTLGNGDSAPPRADLDAPGIEYFGDTMARVMDALGLETVDLYGMHTGARIACEVALLRPDRVRRVVFRGISDFDEATRNARLEHYAPECDFDDYGRQFVWAFNFVRDQALHSPYFKRDPENRLTNRAVPGAADLHERTLDVLKNLTSYHKPYRAAFAYRTTERIAQVTASSLFIKSAGDPPHIAAAATELAALLEKAEVAPIDGSLSQEAAAVAAFLNT